MLLHTSQHIADRFLCRRGLVFLERENLLLRRHYFFSHLIAKLERHSHGRGRRGNTSGDFRPLKPFTSHGEKSFSNRGRLLWNHLPQDLRTTDSLPLFKRTFLNLLSPQLLSLALGNVEDYVWFVIGSCFSLSISQHGAVMVFLILSVGSLEVDLVCWCNLL